MAFFCSLASGSSGNSALYSNGKTNILIDAGTTTKHITQSLSKLSLRPSDLTHILITHGHSDHIAALSVLLKHTSARVVCAEATLSALPALAQDALTFTPGDRFTAGDAPVLTFPTPHDIAGSCGFVIGEGEGSVAVCTDLGYVTKEVFSALTGVRTVFLESNHDLAMLKNGPYPYYLKRRVMSPDGHLSNIDCAQTVLELGKRGARRVILAHLSHTNNTPAHALNESESLLLAHGSNGDVHVTVAPRSQLDEPIPLEEVQCSIFR